ncbi:shikimate kinase [Jeotgalibacillus malaysiensis]|uniref:Shikimate kinase n=1 Tax=Jeotgalibacillus malaysiensis TaxID=1508404 RepID=A0A0B5AMG4_9BACL|nr:shikimate kinase [Jeotgalibacillus malaysiensis]AJD91440.1 shikimate kinase [Jeotgalibacillus malaysiensis]
MRIYLVGFMGAGKSTVGRLLGSKLSATYTDLDQLIEQHADKKISDIFKEDGERAFRHLEADALKTCHSDIIATGGGILYFNETGEWLQNAGLVVYLYAPFEELYKRIQGDSSRPVAAKPYNELKSLFENRDIAYREVSHLTVSVSDRSPYETVSEILEQLRGMKID